MHRIRCISGIAENACLAAHTAVDGDIIPRRNEGAGCIEGVTQNSTCAHRACHKDGVNASGAAGDIVRVAYNANLLVRIRINSDGRIAENSIAAVMFLNNKTLSKGVILQL